MTTMIDGDMSELDEQEIGEMAGYVAGVFDWGSTFRIGIKASGDYDIGYKFESTIEFSHKNEATMGLIEEFLLRTGVNYRKSKRDSGKYLITIARRRDVKQFLHRIYPFVVARHDVTEIMLNEIFPRLEDGDHLNREGFLGIVEQVDRARALTGGRESQYDYQFFKEKWGDL